MLSNGTIDGNLKVHGRKKNQASDDRSIAGGVEQRAARVSLVTGASTLLSIAFQLVSVPICLAYWGEESYGNWLALFAVFMLVRSLDAGFVAYVGNSINYLYHEDRDALRTHLSSAIAGVVVIGVVQLCIGLAAAFSDELGVYLGISGIGSLPDDSDIALLVLLTTWVLSGAYLGIVHRLLVPTGMMFQAAWWSMGFQVSQFLAIILAAMLGFDMLQTSVLFAFLQVAIYLASAVYIKKKLPEFFPWWRGARARTGIHDLSRSLLLAASNFVNQGSVNGAVVIVSALSAPALVPAFTTVRTLANLWTNVTNVLSTPLLPEVVRYHALGQGRKLVATTEAYWVLVGTTLNLGILLAYPWIDVLYGFWTSHTIDLNVPLLCLLLGSVAISNAGGLFTLYLNGINRTRVILATSLIRGFMTLLVGGVLFERIGLVGLGAGMLGGELLVLAVTGGYFAKRELPRHGVALGLSSLAPIGISTTCVLWFLGSAAYAASFLWSIYVMALIGVAGAAYWGWKRLDRDVRSRLACMIINKIPGRA